MHKNFVIGRNGVPFQVVDDLLDCFNGPCFRLRTRCLTPVVDEVVNDGVGFVSRRQLHYNEKEVLTRKKSLPLPAK